MLTDRARQRGRRRRAVIGVLLGGALLAAACGGATTATRQAEVEARGHAVMPFDQRRTTHVFRATDDGGVQSVVARRSSDGAQIRLVRGHLRDEAARFAKGDFSDPMAIHGMTMPGIDALRAGASRIAVRYSDIAAGGRITYTAADPALVDALHAWFDAQLMDHGDNAHR